MKAKLLYLLTLGALLTLALGACGTGVPISEAATQPPADVKSAADPAEVMNDFYSWYLAYDGNPLADRSYQTREELTDDFVDNVNALLDGFDKGAYDPFLCAQDVPQIVQVESLDVEGDAAQAAMTTSFEGHRFLVDLLAGEDGWQITNITCTASDGEEARPAPTVIVNEFYSWYLDYPGNPLADAAYRDRSELSPELVAEVDALLADPQLGMGDPFLCAQDRPGGFEVQLTEGSENTAQVKVATSFEGHSFRVTVTWEEDAWQITQVACSIPQPNRSAPVEGNRFQDNTFGYALALPEGWAFEDVNLNEPGRPPAGNMERIVHLMPVGWNEQYIPLTLEVYAMSAADLEQEIMPADAQEMLEINGLTVIENVYLYGERELVKYDVQAPNTEELHVVLTDFLTGWPERLEGNENIAEQIAEILKSITFTQ